jgi:hypothetical protein
MRNTAAMHNDIGAHRRNPASFRQPSPRRALASALRLRPDHMKTPTIQRLALSTTFLAALSLGAGCVSGGGGPGPIDEDPPPDASLTVVNGSIFAIKELYLASTRNPTWGSNLIAGDVLLPNERKLLSVNCNYYDAMLVDEDGATCELRFLDLCLNNAVWLIKNDTCSAFGLTAQEREPAEIAAPSADTAAR